MKKKNILITCVAVFVVTVAVLVALLCPKDNSAVSYDVFKARSDISAYLNSVIDGNYSKAVKYVALDGELSAELWQKRISDLAGKNIMLSDYRDLDVRTVNGKILATVTLVIRDLGTLMDLETELELELNEKTGLFEIKYKVHDVTDEEIRLEIETALSGIAE